MRPILFYTIGLPGAGKTTLARQLAFLLGCEHLRGDVIGLELFGIPTYSAEERRIVYAEMSHRATESLRRGQHVLYDASVNTHVQRQALVALAEGQGSRAIGLWLETPVALAKQRAGSARDAGVIGRVVRVIPPHIFDHYAAVFETPSAHETVITLSGDAGFYLQYRRLRRELRRLGEHLPPLVQD
ncbi:MAG TPA: ATP-binding protein [Candidatus Saccharimonadales bacterium]|nr:ATP-binding protein [Candidatus Saccharimonadales bacterium]